MAMAQDPEPEEAKLPPHRRLDSDRYTGLRDEIIKEEERGGSIDVMALISQIPGHFITIVIILNAIFMGMTAGTNKDPDLWVVIVDNIFTGIYAIEMVFELYREGPRMYFNDNWRRLDFFLAWLGIVDNWIIAAIDGIDFSSFMVLRLMKLIRLMRLMQLKKELHILFAGVVGAIQAMSWIMVLLVMIIFSMGVFSMSIVDPLLYEGTIYESSLDAPKRFGTLFRSMMTMFNILILDDWSDIIWPMFNVQPFVVIFFIMYLMLSSFGVLNVVVGVVTEQALTISKKQRELTKEAYRRSRMRTIIKLADDVFINCEEVSKEGLEAAADLRPTLIDQLKTIEFPRGFELSDLHLLFDEEFNDNLNKEEFINGMFRLVFNDDFQRDCCTQLHLAKMRQQMTHSFKWLRDEVQRLHQELLQRSSSQPPSFGGGTAAADQESSSTSRRSYSATPVSPEQALSEGWKTPQALSEQTPALRSFELIQQQLTRAELFVLSDRVGSLMNTALTPPPQSTHPGLRSGNTTPRSQKSDTIFEDKLRMPEGSTPAPVWGLHEEKLYSPQPIGRTWLTAAAASSTARPSPRSAAGSDAVLNF